jgi:aminoglycoside phosphotransferase (APT) family kinase protein
LYPIPIHLPELTAYGNSILGHPGELHGLEVSKLAGGYNPQAPYRLNLIFQIAENQFQTMAVVQKLISSTEAWVMQALCQIAAADALPFVIDLFADEQIPESEKSAKSWLVTPYYRGAALTFDDEIPAGVIESLARVHLHFASRLPQSAEVDGLLRVDAAFFRRTLHNALEALARLLPTQEGMTDCHKQLAAIRRTSLFEDVLQRLPVTVVHGDVHPGNIIRSPQGKSVLIDWGNARIAPAMLDLANVVSIGSANWQAYFAAWEQAGGPPQDPYQIRLAYYWAVVMVNLQYLPFAAAHRPENVQQMVERIRDASNRLSG